MFPLVIIKKAEKVIIRKTTIILNYHAYAPSYYFLFKGVSTGLTFDGFMDTIKIRI